MPPHVTLKQLRYFDALAREQHFGRAAETCAVTQPALSMQIHELEDQLGLILVERTRAGVLLSDKGREIAERAARILGDVREMVEFAQHANELLAGSLRLGVIPSIAPYMLPPLLPLLREGYPDLELHVRETQTLPLTHELIEGKLDVLLLALPIVHPEIETLPLFDDRFLLALPAVAPLERARARHQGPRRARAPAPAGGRPLPARPGAHLLQPAASLDRQHLRRLEPFDHRGDGGGRLRHHAAAGDVPQRGGARPRASG